MLMLFLADPFCHVFVLQFLFLLAIAIKEEKKLRKLLRHLTLFIRLPEYISFKIYCNGLPYLVFLAIAAAVPLILLIRRMTLN